ncbi:hypothetical protein GLOIN_2v1709640 [Rhizophagus clarus]|uniref:RING-type domain-containing protein n=1 Tax=Rhizophagus clarus TaxID=94130 RepID=A0A8H3QFC9_9GLOM|nr:hypothetical protein GLOIN_2v1709640 [Rhizophagus clarus]
MSCLRPRYYHTNKTIFGRLMNDEMQCVIADSSASVGKNRSDTQLLTDLSDVTVPLLVATHIGIPDMNPCSSCGKEIYSLASNPLYEEFTLASCGHIFHQKCLEKYLEKGSQDKPSTTDENTTSMPIDSENATPDENANVTVMKELGLLGGEEQIDSSTTLDISENVDNSQIQRPICEKCFEEISIEFSKDTAFLSCKHAVHYDCIDNPRKKCPTCPSSEGLKTSDVQKKHIRESTASTEKH